MTAVRHGESELNAAGRFTGQLDPPLTPRGRRQAAALAVVAAGSFDLRLHSGLRRAEQTLRIACRAAGLRAAPLVGDGRWKERSLGVLEGLPVACGPLPSPDVDAAPVAGESYRDLGVRVHAALEELASEAAGRGAPLSVLVCTHSGVLRILRALADPELAAAALLTAAGAGQGDVVELSYAAGALPPLLAPART